MQAKKPSKTSPSPAQQPSLPSREEAYNGGNGQAYASGTGLDSSDGQKPPTDAVPIRQRKQLASEGL